MLRYRLRWHKILNRKIPALSIIELSITLVVIGIMSFGCMALFKIITIRGQLKINEYRHTIITQALCRFASQYGYLPIPVNHNNTQLLSQTYTEFSVLTGYLPYQLLGLAQNIVENIVYTVDARFTNPQLKPISYKQFELTNITDDAICFIKNFKVSANPKPDALDQLMICNNGKTIYTYGQSFQAYQVIGQLYQSQQTNIIDHGITSHMRAAIATSSDNPSKISYNIIQGRPKIELLAPIYDCIVFVLTTHTKCTNKSQSSSLSTHSTQVFNHSKHLNHSNADSSIADTSLDNPGYIQTEHYKYVSYTTRFNLELYGGPKCRPFIKNKSYLTEIISQFNSSQSTDHTSHPIYTIDTKNTCHIITSFIDITPTSAYSTVQH